MSFRSHSYVNSIVGLTFVAVSWVATSNASAQSTILTEIFGRGVHAYHSGQYDQASQYLSMAIDNGFRDPRAYYFRGLATAASGRALEAQSDFELGADIEAQGAFGDSVGRSLARIQGSTRMQLESIREQARLEALAIQQARSQARYGELGLPGGNAPPPAAPPRPGAASRPVPPAGTAARPAAPARPRAVTPPNASAVADPFADDLDQDPVVESSDVLKGAMDNAALGDSAPADTGDAPASASPFDAPTGDDPFAPPVGGADPFGGGAADDDDPFGGF